MKTFDYVRPATVREAVVAAAEPGAAYLAAGTNLLDLMKGGITRPSRLVDISHLPDLDRIEDLSDGGVRIGALVRNADLARDRTFARRFPAVAEALLSGASAQLRNAATVGGNLLQRTRCAYFYDVASACNKRNPGSGCGARGGENRLHAVMGWSESCIATHPSDFCVPLVALDAVVEVEGGAGRREIPLEVFHRLPGDVPERESMLEPGEMIVAVRLPAEAVHFAAHARYLKVRERTSYAFAVVSAAAALRVEDDTIAQARLALGGVAMKPWRARSPFLGGGFGSKGLISGPQVLGSMAARVVGRPVKLVLGREQMFGPVGHRAPTRQTLRMGADNDGKLAALDHRTKTTSSTYDDFFEPASDISHTLYASTAIATSHEAVRVDTGTPLFMRAPGEATGSIALESAVDEMAQACGMDPLAFRLKNYAEVEPISGKPFSSKALRDCYTQGGARFGWERRPLAPRQMRDHDGSLVGWGLGTATFPALMFEAQAKAVLRQDGSGVMEIGAHDMGQGAWTALAQIAADGLGLDIDQVEFRSGTSDLPDAGIAGGSAHTATAGMAIHNAGADVVARLADLATNDDRSALFGAGNAGVIARGGRLFRRDDESRSESYSDILGRVELAEIEGQGKSAANQAAQSTYAMHAHGAVFTEVKADPDLGQVRVTRVLGAFAAGRIINPRMVRSQLCGGMIWGVSFALLEHAVMDPRSGRPMNPNLGEYHIPVNADVPSIEAILVEERDPHVNALGIKGVGEIGITGTAGAVANAVWHATGVRVRKFPITLDRLIEPQS